MKRRKKGKITDKKLTKIHKNRKLRKRQKEKKKTPVT